LGLSFGSAAPNLVVRGRWGTPGGTHPANQKSKRVYGGCCATRPSAWYCLPFAASLRTLRRRGERCPEGLNGAIRSPEGARGHGWMEHTCWSHGQTRRSDPGANDEPHAAAAGRCSRQPVWPASDATHDWASDLSMTCSG
jgi:hypothetical protein